MDDAGVMRITPELALVQTLDFFQPIVNDPKTFGRIVAANSLSDVWAMGGKAVTAMNILAYPVRKMPTSAIEELLTGACEKLQEAGVVLVGGHTMEQDEFVYGMSVTGLINPASVLTNARARVGDKLVLTKPLGTGIYAEGLYKDGLSETQYDEFVASMERLNLYASRILRDSNVSAMTDVTGFGLLGHALPIARNADVTLHIHARAVPFLPDAMSLLERFVPRQPWKNKDYVEPHALREETISSDHYSLLLEAQTSGGLLAALSADVAGRVVDALRRAGDESAAIIGEVEPLETAADGKKVYLRITDT